MSENDFKNRDAKMKALFPKLATDNTVSKSEGDSCQKVTIESLEQLKEFLNNDHVILPGNDVCEKDLSSLSYDTHLLKKANDYIYKGMDTFTEVEREHVNKAFPMDLSIVSKENKTINGKLTIGSGKYNYGTVILNDQAYIEAIDTEFDFTADVIIRKGSAPDGKADFNIYGKNGATGDNGEQGATGSRGNHGSGGNCSSAGIAGAAGGNAETGKNGKDGTKGEDGKPGSPYKKAIIRIIQSLEGNLKIYARSGAGGNGGTGGIGGTGGNGGDGGNGVTCGCTGSAGGNAGNGGNGGRGGNGGNGGDGGKSTEQITIFAPRKDLNKISINTEAAPYGTGGSGGKGGNAGKAGSAGSGGKHNESGKGGENGNPGNSGSNGKNGNPGNEALIEIFPI